MKIPNNFGGLEKEFTDYKKAKIVVLPIPFDKTSTYLKGSDKGPKAIIKASQNVELYDIETASEVYRQGIFTAGEIKAETSLDLINKTEKTVKKYLTDKKTVVCLGGEHSVSLGPIKACAEFFNNLSVLHLDAHSDSRDSYLNNKYSHASVMARVKEILPSIISVGIRSQDLSELKNINKKNIFYAHQIVKSPEWIKKVVKRLTANVYLTVDLDVFDPAFVPATGTPEPGGLNWYQVTDLLKEVMKNKKVVCFDVVELCPTNQKISDFLAAKLIYTLLSYKFKYN